MKVYYNGFNLHRQFPNTQNIVENFIDHVYQDLEKIEVSYHYVVLVVADVVVVKSAKNETFSFDEKIAQIACTEDKILVLLSNGELVKITDAVIKVPKLVDLDEGDVITRICAGSKLTIAVTKKGFLYNLPNRLEFSHGEEIVDVKTGREHCLVLDKTGNVYSFGRGSRGQLGHGSLDDEDEPRLVEALGGLKIASIAAGGWHSCALSTEGDVYMWGWNGNGQLGGETVSVMATPQLLDVDFNISKVGCGNRHSVFLTDDRKLYGCGWNKYKQLMNDNRENVYQVTYLGDFSKDVVSEVKCGPWNTVVLCEGGGSGGGEMKQL